MNPPLLWLIFLGIALVPCVIYAVMVMLEVPGMADERLGTLEELPDDVGEWKIDSDSEPARSAAAEGLVRETRLWINPHDQFGRKKIFRQTRYLDRETLDVVRTEKDVRIRRKRVKKS